MTGNTSLFSDLMTSSMLQEKRWYIFLFILWLTNLLMLVRSSYHTLFIYMAEHAAFLYQRMFTMSENKLYRLNSYIWDKYLRSRLKPITEAIFSFKDSLRRTSVGNPNSVSRRIPSCHCDRYLFRSAILGTQMSLALSAKSLAPS